MASNLDLLGAILAHTPVWVWILFAVLIAIGAQAMRRRIVSPHRLMIAPAVFIAWGVAGLLAKLHFSVLLAADWAGALVVGAALGWATTRLSGLAVDRATGHAHLPGSSALLIRIVTVFIVKYVFGVLTAISPDMAAVLAPWYVAVSGLMAGYFLGWLVKFRARYLDAPEAVFAPAVGQTVAIGVAE